MEQKNNLKFPIILLVAGLIAGFLIGYYLVGKNMGFRGVNRQQLEDLVSLTFPKPPEDLRTVLGKITKIDGNKIQMEVGDPEDYLPHADGSPQRTMSRTARVTGETQMYLLRPAQIDKSGNISKTALKLNELKAGDSITVTAGENVRTAKEFDAVLIEKVEF